MRKRFVALALVFALTLAGCGDTKKEASETTEAFAFSDDIYYFYYGGTYGSKYLDERHSETSYVFIKMHSDGIVEWVDAGEENAFGARKTNKYYGKYELDGRIVTITLSGDESVLGVISQDGEAISIGNESLEKADGQVSKQFKLVLMEFD